jgi:uncharacterized membrane protein YjgN (DUF898 family)
MSEQFIGRYHGDKKTLFWLVMKTSFLTLITLGIYRFWAKTRIRKYLWSATAAGQDSFEYTGTGLEKFLGFLVAIVVLAIYLGIVQMILLFFGLSLMADATTTAGQIAQIVSIYISFFAVMPLIFFAQYRARRYKMARTRWRGIRFGMDSAAWGFVWRAIAHSFLTIITLGLMVPRQTFYLEKYMADRTWFGDAQFVQNGRWQSLYPGLKHIGLGFLILIGAGVVAATLEAFRVAFFLGVVGYIWLIFGSVYYRIFALNYLTDNKLLNGQIGFYSDAQAGKVVGIAIKGTLLIALVGAVIGLVFTGVSAVLLTSVDFQNPSDLMGVVGGALGVIGFVAYIGFLLLLSALSFIWITQPIIAHVVDNIVLSGAEHLDAIQQRSADAGADADGFADALDIGGAI